jgi:hypothetical protein
MTLLKLWGVMHWADLDEKRTAVPAAVWSYLLKASYLVLKLSSCKIGAEKFPMKPTCFRSSLHLLILLSMLLSLAAGAIIVTPTKAAEGPRYAKPTPDGVNTGSCDSWGTACTLERALLVAGELSASTVWVQEGTYTPPAPRGERAATITLTTNLSLYGGFAGTETSFAERDPTTHITILSGDIGTQGDASDNSYHVVTGASGATVDGLTITGGNANGTYPEDSGGGIFNTTGTLTVANSIFSANNAVKGGGIYNTGTSNITGSTFTGNHSVYGGAIQNDGGTITIGNSAFSNNNGSLGGGLLSSGTINITTSTLSGNSAGKVGGIYNVGTINMNNSTLSGNSASAGSKYGGGVYSDGTLNVANSTFSVNSGEYGGGIYFYGGTADIRNSTFSGNGAISGFGSGIYTAFGTIPVTFCNTIVANSTSGSNCLAANPPINGGNNLEDGNSCGWGTMDKSKSGIDPQLGPLISNGGFTQTFALLADSPAIDAGNNAVCAAVPVNNSSQNGVTRPQGIYCDIGSYEAPVTITGFTVFLPLVRR